MSITKFVETKNLELKENSDNIIQTINAWSMLAEIGSGRNHKFSPNRVDFLLRILHFFVLMLVFNVQVWISPKIGFVPPYSIAYAYRLCLCIVGERSKQNTAYGKSDGTWEGYRHTPTTVMLCEDRWLRSLSKVYIMKHVCIKIWLKTQPLFF